MKMAWPEYNSIQKGGLSMVKLYFSKIKKTMPILFTLLFLATLTVTSASATYNNPVWDEHGHHWMIGEHVMRYDGQFWWDDIHHLKWDGHQWWNGNQWWDGHHWWKGTQWWDGHHWRY
jgi:hypothetical protein